MLTGSAAVFMWRASGARYVGLLIPASLIEKPAVGVWGLPFLLATVNKNSFRGYNTPAWSRKVSLSLGVRERALVRVKKCEVLAGYGPVALPSTAPICLLFELPCELLLNSGISG